MKVECVPLTSFIHGSLTMNEGRPQMVEESTAKELERAGLIRIRTAPVAAKAVASGKETDDGPGQPSSVSQAAPASPTPTSPLSKSGKGKTRSGIA